MARARFIRPEFFTDTKLADMPMGASLLFAGIWCHSDLNGVFDYDARVLRSLVFGVREDVSTKDVECWLGMLHTAGILLAYCQHDGKKVGVVKNWAKYQSVSGSERKWGSRRPNPLDPNTTSSMTELSAADCRAQACPLTPTPTPTPTPTMTPTPTPTQCVGPVFQTKEGRQWRLSQTQYESMENAHGGIDLDAELARAAAWNNAAGDKQKTFAGMGRFVNGWLSRASATATNQSIPESEQATAEGRQAMLDEIAKLKSEGKM